MPNVVVYVPAKVDRVLRDAGISPSTIVKNGAREALLNIVEQLEEDSGAADVGASSGDTPSAADVSPRVTAPEPHFKPDPK